MAKAASRFPLNSCQVPKTTIARTYTIITRANVLFMGRYYMQFTLKGSVTMSNRGDKR